MSIFKKAYDAVKHDLGVFFGFIDEPRQRFLVENVNQVVSKVGFLFIEEPNGKKHAIHSIDVSDGYFWRLKQQPEKADLLIWILPAEEARYLDYQEVYAGTFIVGSPAYEHTRKLIEQLGWDVIER